MIVDDDRALARVMAAALRSQGYVISVFSSAEDALDELVHEAPDLLLLDIVLPGRDGWATLRELAERPEGTGMPVILISSNPVGRRQLEEGQPSAFLRKPFGMSDLLETVRNVFATTGRFNSAISPGFQAL
ncbi:MAG: response regulator [Dehalococcoidia bacterium]